MLDPMFSFVDPIVEPIIELSEDSVIPVEIFFDFLEKVGVEKPRSLPEGVNLKEGMPVHIALSLLRPDELEKVRKYVTAYMAKHHSGEIN